MPSFTVRVGILLVIFGVASYVTSRGVSVTALIPSVIGAVLALCGIVAVRQPPRRSQAMHVAAVVALIGLFGTASALLRVPALVDGAEVTRRPAVISRASMALILLIYLTCSVKSFVDARVRPKA